MKKLTALLALVIGFALPSWTQTYALSTIAGVVPSTSDTLASQLQIQDAEAVAIDSAGNIYIADAGAHKVFKIDATTGIATVVAGTGVSGSTNTAGAGNKTTISLPSGLVTDSSGNLYIADRDGRVKKLDSKGNLTTFITGNGYAGDSFAVAAASVNQPRGMAIGPDGNLYIADTSNNRIRLVNLKTGIISTVAGSGTAGTCAPTFQILGCPGDGGPARLARLNVPEDVAVDSKGNLYIADTGNHRIRKVANGIMTTVAGTWRTPPSAVTKTYDAQGNLVSLATTGGTTGAPTNSGNGGAGAIGVSGDPLNLQLNGPAGLAIDAAGNLIVADRGNGVLRSINFGANTMTVIGTGFSSPNRIAVTSDGAILVAEAGTTRVRRFDPSTGAALVIAGTAHNSVATNPLGNVLNLPNGIAIDKDGNLYVSDTGNACVRKFDTQGNASVFAGFCGTSGLPRSEGLLANASPLNSPRGLAFDSQGNLFIADQGNNRIVKVNATDGTVNTYAGLIVVAGGVLSSTNNSTTLSATVSNPQNNTTGGNNNPGSTNNPSALPLTPNDGGPALLARLNGPRGVAVDANDNLLIADTGDNAIRLVQNGIITTIAGFGITPLTGGVAAGYEGDGGPASLSLLNGPQGIAVDKNTGNIIFADSGNGAIREITASYGNIYTIASGLSNPQGVAIDSKGKVYISNTTAGQVRVIDPATLASTIIAGQGTGTGATGGGPGAAPFSGGTGATNQTYNLNFADAALANSNGRLGWTGPVAVDANGNVYVTDMGNGLIRLLKPPAPTPAP